MYNEPNIFFWRPTPNVGDYVKLALAVGKALHQAAPDETYIGPAASTMDFNFLEACFKAGLLEYWSGVSVHPYRQSPPETVAGDYEKLRALIGQYAPKGKKIPILSGEWGYSSAWNDESRQGQYLAREWLTNLSNGVPISIWYDWHDDGTAPNNGEHHFGTVHFAEHSGRDPLYDPKPAYEAAKTLTHALAGFRFDRRAAVGGADDYALVFKREKEVRLVMWTPSEKAHDVVLPLRNGTLHSISHLGKKLDDVIGGEKGIVVTLTESPQYLTPDDSIELDAALGR
jgi:hypothetical protein